MNYIIAIGCVVFMKECFFFFFLHGKKEIGVQFDAFLTLTSFNIIHEK